jgi:hypothetical protein
MTAEPGCIIILPPFQVSAQGGWPSAVDLDARLTPFPSHSQRTHVLTHAAGTLMHRILDSPALGGLGLRRCQWFTTTLNNPSKNAALRLGFDFEGTIRAHRVLPPSKEVVRRAFKSPRWANACCLADGENSWQTRSTPPGVYGQGQLVLVDHMGGMGARQA